MSRRHDIQARAYFALAENDRSALELTTDEARRLIDDVAALKAPVFVLTGGDPLKRPDIFELVEYASANGVRISLTPSATPLLTRDAIGRLKGSGLARLGAWAVKTKLLLLSRFSRIELAPRSGTSSMTEPQDSSDTRPIVRELTGTISGRFAISGLLGTGGMGQVYRAQDNTLKRVVAIKRMAPKLQFEERDRQRFLKEAQRASALNHPNIAAIYDVLEVEGEILLVMEYIEGATLRLRMLQPISIEEFLDLAIQCAEGVGAAHQQHIVHGDIKPDNIMLTPARRVKILDFGVAKRFAFFDPNEATESLTAFLSGTPAYMAPEVLMQKPNDGRADLFSLGLVFYEMLGGRQPFQADSPASTLARVLHAEVTPLRKVNPKVPPSLAAVVSRMLEKNPEARYASTADLAADLRAIQQGVKPAGVQVDRRPYLRTLVQLGIILAFIAAGLLSYAPVRRAWHTRVKNAEATVPSLPSNEVLAVLPFPAGDNPKLTALGRGLVDSVSAKLGRLTGDRALAVIPARTLQQRSVTSLADARSQFGANLGLAIALEQSENLIHVKYLLLNAQDGRTVGGDSIAVPLGDAFGVEDDLARGAVRALRLTLRPEEQIALNVHGTDRPDAYKYYLQASGYLLDYAKSENVENAIIMANEALKLDPNFGKARAVLGEAYWRKYWLSKQDSWTKLAQNECDSAVNLGNAGAAGHTCLGLVNDGTGRYQQAAAEFQRAIDLEPTNQDAYIGLALALEHRGAINEAEKTYESAISLQPGSPVVYNSLGTFYLRRKEYEKALSMFRKVIELAPEGYAAYVNLGATLSNMGRYDESIEPLKKSIALRASYAAYVNLGTTYFGLNRFADAAAAYEQAIKLDPDEYVTWGNLGDARKYLGAKHDSQSAFRKAIELAEQELKVNPHDPDVLSSLASYYSQLGDRNHALLYLEQALRNGHHDKDILLDAAEVYNNLGETGLAVEWLGKTVQAGYPANKIRGLPEFRNLENNPGYVQLMGKSQVSK
jgi:serine/threonine protein kinase/tetratricopeptide (TPR) repeat protein